MDGAAAGGRYVTVVLVGTTSKKTWRRGGRVCVSMLGPVSSADLGGSSQ